MKQPLVVLKDVTRCYDRHRGVDDINLDFERGEIIGLVGPNGCGKTTLIKLIMGLLQPDQGDILIDGLAPGQAHHLIAYLPEKTYLDDNTTMAQAFRLFGQFYADFDEAKARRMLSEFGLSLDQSIRSMSKGMQEKAQLVLVMSRNVPLYILDEPMSGIDPAARQTILDGILENYQPESTLLISTHLISDVEMLFDRVIFLDRGRVLLDKPVEQLRAQEGKSIDGLFRDIYRNPQGDNHVA